MSDSSAPRFGLWDAMRAVLALIVKQDEIIRAIARQPGPEGKPGRDGEPGRITEVRSWSDKVHQKLDLVTHNGSIWQAKQQTGKEPPHSDWTRIVERGADGAELSPQRTFKADAEYKRLSLVNHDGASWIATRDAPGTPGDGDGWQLLASRGKTGRDGGRGDKGDRGPPGQPAPRFVVWRAEPVNYLAYPVLSDGTEGAPLDVRPFLEQFRQDLGL